ncbi:tRNA (guanine(10)-N(2))-dimethyltransferase [[Eubacterium] cellulosolvens]
MKLVLPTESDQKPADPNVFYNPRMSLNRDISVLAAQCFQSHLQRSIRIADPLTGSGIRGLRYAAEVDSNSVLLNDIEPDAVLFALHNMLNNNLQDKTDIQCMDANIFLNLHSIPGKRLDLIDLDPYGSPVTYIDSALRALINGGFLAITATDMAVLCGAKPRSCLRKYGGKPLRSEYSREVALRLLFGSVVTSACKQDMTVNAKFSHSTDHYIRLFVNVNRSAIEANNTLAEMGYILHCFHCLNRMILKDPAKRGRCSICDSSTALAGPLYLGRLTDPEFCLNMIASAYSLNKKSNRLSKILSLIKDEVEAPPTYYTVDSICHRLHKAPPSPNRVIEDLKSQDYYATNTHFDGGGFKTNATIKDIISVMNKLN